MTVEIKTLTGSDSESYPVPFKNIYILNDGGKGWIRINNTLKLDIEKIDKVENLTIKKLEWNLTDDGTAVFVVLSHEKLSTEYITRLMLSRIYSELQNKAGKKKIVYVDASSSTTVTAGTTEVITVAPPSRKIYRVLSAIVDIPAPTGATTGTHSFQIRSSLHPWTGVQAGAAYNSKIVLAYNTPYTGSWNPSTADALIVALYRTVATPIYPLEVFYKNGTDVSQTGTRTVKLILEEEDEAE